MALPLASTVSAATMPKAANNRPRRPRSYHDDAVFISNLQLAEILSRSPGLPRAARGCCVLRSGLLEAIDRLETSVRLDHGQEHLIGAAIAGCAIREREAAEIEAAGVLHGVDQGLPGGLAIDLFERRDDGAADKVALERDEARLRIGGARL